MRERWLRLGVLAGALFAINVVARLVTRLAFADDIAAKDRITIAMMIAVGLVMAGTAFVWGRLRPQGVVAADLAAGGGTGGLLSIVVGPLVSGEAPLDDGAGFFFSQVWLYAGVAGGGALLGLLFLIMLGRDYKSQSLKRFAEAQLAKPKRPIRR